MSDRIDPEVIEAAAKARHEAKAADENLPFKWHEMPAWHRERQMKFEEVAIRAADRERGLKEERRVRGQSRRGRGAQLGRLVSDWRPVERSS